MHFHGHASHRNGWNGLPNKFDPKKSCPMHTTPQSSQQGRTTFFGVNFFRKGISTILWLPWPWNYTSFERKLKKPSFGCFFIAISRVFARYSRLKVGIFYGPPCIIYPKKKKFKVQRKDQNERDHVCANIFHAQLFFLGNSKTIFWHVKPCSIFLCVFVLFDTYTNK